MKNLKGYEKLVFFINTAAALLLLLSYLLPYLPPKDFAFLSVLSLAVPLFIILNLVFVLYWLLKAKKQLLLSAIVLLLGYGHVLSLYKFTASKDVKDGNAITVMNYNVRLFNLYGWIEEEGIEEAVVNLITQESPDVVSFQEYHPHENVDLSMYPYKFEDLSGERVRYGQAIFSKFPIINSGSVSFPNTANNAIYADVVKNNDTIRIYNVHLQSMGIEENLEDLNRKDSERLLKLAAERFKMQQEQAELFVANKEKAPHKVIICGDFNNTAFSYVYKMIKGELNDSFEEAGNGFGRTFKFRYFPVRIDFILVDATFEVNSFKVLEEKLSDHYPVVTNISLHK